MRTLDVIIQKRVETTKSSLTLTLYLYDDNFLVDVAIETMRIQMDGGT